MNIQPTSRVMLVHAHKNLSSTCGELMWYSVVRAKSEDGCLDCQLQWDASGEGRWIVRATWASEDSMKDSFEQIFQPTINKLIAREVLLSIKVFPDEQAANLAEGKSSPISSGYSYSANWR